MTEEPINKALDFSLTQQGILKALQAYAGRTMPREANPAENKSGNGYMGMVSLQPVLVKKDVRASAFGFDTGDYRHNPTIENPYHVPKLTNAQMKDELDQLIGMGVIRRGKGMDHAITAAGLAEANKLPPREIRLSDLRQGHLVRRGIIPPLPGRRSL